MSMEPEGNAAEFFDRLEEDPGLQSEVKQGIEKLAKNLGFNVTEEELSAELQKRWQCQGTKGPPYSEPPGF